MEKWAGVTVLILLADFFAIFSLYRAEWINSYKSTFQMRSMIGLMTTCVIIPLNNSDFEEMCYTPKNTPREWLVTFALILLGSACLSITVVLVIFACCSSLSSRIIGYARWLGFLAMVVFCLAAIIFPIGFTIDEIGGQPFLLPSNCQVGVSYIVFIISIFLTFTSELFLAKVCMPHI